MHVPRQHRVRRKLRAVNLYRFPRQPTQKTEEPAGIRDDSDSTDWSARPRSLNRLTTWICRPAQDGYMDSRIALEFLVLAHAPHVLRIECVVAPSAVRRYGYPRNGKPRRFPREAL